MHQPIVVAVILMVAFFYGSQALCQIGLRYATSLHQPRVLQISQAAHVLMATLQLLHTYA